MSPELRRTILRNVIWLLVSLTLATGVWVAARLQSDPVEERVYSPVRIQFSTDEGLIITDTPRETARVFVRAQQSQINRLTIEDVVVRANLTGLGPGTHTIPLQVEVARPASADSQPAQLTVTLERVVTRQKPVVIAIAQPPATDLDYDPAEYDVFQAAVSGADADVERVEAVVGEVDLSDVRSATDAMVTLSPVDASGTRVDDVTVNPRQVRVSINVYTRDDTRLVSILPNYRSSTLPEGYFVARINKIDPQTVFVRELIPGALDQIGNVIQTPPIDLTGRTDDFEVTVPIILPSDRVRLLGDTTTVTIGFVIDAQTSSVTLEGIPVEVVGVSSGFQYTLSAQTVSVIFNGPASLLRDLRASDVQAVIDLEALAPGSYALEPRITVLDGRFDMSQVQVTVLPPDISVNLLVPVTPVPVTPTLPPGG